MTSIPESMETDELKGQQRMKFDNLKAPCKWTSLTKCLGTLLMTKL